MVTNMDTQKKAGRKLDLGDCYSELELRDADIYVYYSLDGNPVFTWQPNMEKYPELVQVELGYLPDRLGSPFMFAVSWMLDYVAHTWRIDKYAKGEPFGMNCIEAIYKPGMRYWAMREDGKFPVKVTEKPLKWFDTDLDAEGFRKELYVRLCEAKCTFMKKYEILRWKHRVVQDQCRRSLTVKDCINGNLVDGSLEKTGHVVLANGVELELTKVNDNLVVARDDDTDFVYIINRHPFYERERLVFTVDPKEREVLSRALATY